MTQISEKASKREMTPEEVAENVRKVAKDVKDASVKLRMVVKALRESGALNETAEAIREAVLTSRYTAKEIGETAKEMESKGLFKEVAGAAIETKESAKNTLQLMKGVTSAATA
jgi:hypothetical protein